MKTKRGKIVRKRANAGGKQVYKQVENSKQTDKVDAEVVRKKAVIDVKASDLGVPHWQHIMQGQGLQNRGTERGRPHRTRGFHGGVHWVSS